MYFSFQKRCSVFKNIFSVFKIVFQFFSKVFFVFVFFCFQKLFSVFKNVNCFLMVTISQTVLYWQRYDDTTREVDRKFINSTLKIQSLIFACRFVHESFYVIRWDPTAINRSQTARHMYNNAIAISNNVNESFCVVMQCCCVWGFVPGCVHFSCAVCFLPFCGVLNAGADV